jgi:hypothetical protein
MRSRKRNLISLPWDFGNFTLQYVRHKYMILMLFIVSSKDVRSLESLWPIAEDVEKNEDAFCGHGGTSYICYDGRQISLL